MGLLPVCRSFDQNLRLCLADARFASRWTGGKPGIAFKQANPLFGSRSNKGLWNRPRVRSLESPRFQLPISFFIHAVTPPSAAPPPRGAPESSLPPKPQSAKSRLHRPGRNQAANRPAAENKLLQQRNLLTVSGSKRTSRPQHEGAARQGSEIQ
jgi:hypothetical protein